MHPVGAEPPLDNNVGGGLPETISLPPYADNIITTQIECFAALKYLSKRWQYK